MTLGTANANLQAYAFYGNPVWGVLFDGEQAKYEVAFDKPYLQTSYGVDYIRADAGNARVRNLETEEVIEKRRKNRLCLF